MYHLTLYQCSGEDAFLAAVISEVNGGAVQFKLAPTYTVYMATRFRISMAYRPKMSPEERADRLTALVNKVANHVQQTIQVRTLVYPYGAFDRMETVMSLNILPFH